MFNSERWIALSFWHYLLLGGCITLSLGSFLLLTSAGMRFTAWLAKRRGARLVARDAQMYAAEWHRLVAAQGDALEQLRERSQELATTAKKNAVDAGLFQPGTQILLQQARGLDEIFEDAEAVSDAFLVQVKAWGANCANKHSGGIKGQERSLQKVRRTYADNPRRIMDACRGSLIFDSADELLSCLDKLAAEAMVVRLKNRLDPNFNALRDCAGYRDLQVSIAWPLPMPKKHRAVHVCELQLHLKTLFKLKTDGGHRRYIEFRNLRGS